MPNQLNIAQVVEVKQPDSSNEIKEDRYRVEVAESALESAMITSSVNERVDLRVNETNGKIIITAKRSLVSH